MREQLEEKLLEIKALLSNKNLVASESYRLEGQQEILEWLLTILEE